MSIKHIRYEDLKLGSQDVPSYDGLIPVILMILEESGKPMKVREINKELYEVLDMPDDIKYKKFNNGNSILDNRISWAVSFTSVAGLTNRVSRATYEINDFGKKILSEYGMKLDISIIKTLPEYKKYQEDLKIISPESTNTDEPENDVESTMHDESQKFNSRVRTEILQRISGEDPTFFEHLVAKLLAAMGYKGENGSVEVTKRSNDGGIDAIISQDALGTSTVYLQAKRYKDGNNVQAPELQSFYGALKMRSANRGVFITTSDFSEGARQVAKQFSIVLVNGIKLTELMLQYHVGVQVKETYELFEIDEDFFDF